MTIIYTDSKERAIKYATIIGGIIIGQDIVREKNVNEYRDALNEKLAHEGYLHTLFRGESYIICYTNGNPMLPCKMIDYDSSYRSLKNRPIPFIPDEFRYYIVDNEFESHISIYKELVKKNNIRSVINAAADDITGELSFYHFITQTDISDLTLYRIYPQYLTEKSIIEAINSPKDEKLFFSLMEAAKAKTEMDWLINCNASNCLTKNVKNSKVMAVGRLESLILNILWDREKKVSGDAYKPLYMIQANIKGNKHIPEISCTVSQIFASEDEAQSVAEELKSNGIAVTDVFSDINDVAPTNLLDVFSLEDTICDKLHMDCKTAAYEIENLFVNGMISWPTEVHLLPWSAKTQYVGSITALNKQEMYSGRVAPRDVDVFERWDSNNSTYIGYHIRSHMGVLVSEKLPDSNITDDQYYIYDCIARNNIEVLKQKECEASLSIAGTCGADIINLQYSSKYSANSKSEKNTANEYIKKYTGLPRDTKLTVTDISITTTESFAPYTESELIRVLSFLLANAGASKENIMCNDRRLFVTPINNLIAWDLISRSDDGTLNITENGLREIKYISGTSLASSTSVLDWDRRLSQIANGFINYDDFMNDVNKYINDLVEELSVKAEEVNETIDLPVEECMCPICNSLVEKSDAGWECSNQACDFTIPSTFYDHALVWQDVCDILINRKTSLVRDFTSPKNSKQFAARIVLNDRNKLELSFESPFSCPKCGTRMNEYSWGVACPQQSCRYTFNSTICGVQLTDTDIDDILSGRKSRVITGLKNKNGKYFSASLYLDEEKGLSLEFPNKDKENDEV